MSISPAEQAAILTQVSEANLPCAELVVKLVTEYQQKIMETEQLKQSARQATFVHMDRVKELEVVAYDTGKKLETREQELSDSKREIEELKSKVDQGKKLYNLTLDNELRWMRKHEDLQVLIRSLRDWKSPDGVLQVKDLKWFKEQNT